MTAAIVQFIPRPNPNRQEATNLALIDDPTARRIAHALIDREPIIDTRDLSEFDGGDCA